MSIEATLFKRPNGAKETTQIDNIRPEDEAWFRAHNAKLSMEDIGDSMVCYADIGLTVGGDPDEDPDEAIEISAGRSCEDTFAALRKQCEQMLAAA